MLLSNISHLLFFKEKRIFLLKKECEKYILGKNVQARAFWRIGSYVPGPCLDLFASWLPSTASRRTKRKNIKDSQDSPSHDDEYSKDDNKYEAESPVDEGSEDEDQSQEDEYETATSVDLLTEDFFETSQSKTGKVLSSLS